MSGMDGTIEVSLWRGKADGRYQAYTVPLRENQTVLDVVTWVQRHADPTLSYRFACRVGMCGSCAMTVNGRPRWTCRTHISKVVEDGRVEIGPLANLPVIKDLACDMAAFFEKWQKAKGVFAPSKTRHDADREDRAGERAAHRRRRRHRVHQLRACAIAACDTVRWNEDYLGPAALNRAWTLVNDVRDAGNRERLAARGGQRRLPRLPLAPELPGALPQGAQPHRLHRRPQAPHDAGLHPGRAVMADARATSATVIAGLYARDPACSGLPAALWCANWTAGTARTAGSRGQAPG